MTIPTVAALESTDLALVYSADLGGYAGVPISVLAAAVGGGSGGGGTGDLLAANNLSDLDSPSAARSNLGLAAGATASLASQADAEAGTNNTKIMTPLRVAQAIEELAPEGSTSGPPSVVALTTHTLVAGDVGALLLQQGTSSVTLSINTTANSGIAWLAGKFFMLGSVNSGAVTLTALTGVTIVNVGTKTVVQDDTPLVVMMSPTTNRWLVL